MRTAIAPIVRWANVSSSASPAITVTPIWGHRFSDWSTTGITLTNNSLVLSMTSTSYNVSSTIFQRFCRVGGTVYIPYSATSGTNGSLLNAGTYYINSVTGFSVSVTKKNTLSATEAATVGGITIYQHAFTSPTCFDNDAVVLGFRNKMQIPYNAFNDDSCNGIS